jgi:PadR family transcriptional regulator PadR
MKDLSLYESIHLLAILRLGNNAYGVSIKEEIASMTGREISYGTLYSYLDQLFKKDLVKKSAGDPSPERGGRRKIYYKVSAQGAEALKSAYSLQKSIWNETSQLALGIKELS